MIKEILVDRPKKMIAPCSHHQLVAVSFAWKQLLKQQDNRGATPRKVPK
jgi:hypothetical protein